MRPPPPKLILRSVERTATTYRFGVDGDFGWAYCTVNDATGELLIVSDWGNWSHAWSPEPAHLGAPSLTAFIGRRSADDVDYLARKLQPGRHGGEQFSPAKTAAALRRVIAERRLEDGRALRRPRLTRELARELWDEVHSVAEDCGGSSDLFLDRLSAELQHVIEEPWDELQYEQTTGDHALRDVILPALIEACRARVADAAAAPSAEVRA